MVKSYRVISLLEYMGKIFEKIVINEFFRIYEINDLFQPTQIRARKSRNTINAIVILIDNIEKIWAKKDSIIGAIFINVKNAFDYIIAKKLTTRITKLNIDIDIIGQIRSFFKNRKIELIIDSHIYKKVAVKTGIL